jgi:hypothetical protein
MLPTLVYLWFATWCLVHLIPTEPARTAILVLGLGIGMLLMVGLIPAPVH